jgi:hypothetical protein
MQQELRKAMVDVLCTHEADQSVFFVGSFRT